MKSSDRQGARLDLVTAIADFQLREPRNPLNYLSIAVLLVAALYFSFDIYQDLVVEAEALSHVLLEGGIFVAMLLALGFEVKRSRILSTRISINREQILRLKQHLRDMISEEFDRWDLTASEKEIALLLIKGYSMQEIAGFRGVKEKSVRQQSTRIYAKANVSNRYELTSYFIEDLLATDSALDPVKIAMRG